MWPAIIVASLGCYAIKLLGLSLPGKVVSNPRVTHIADLLPVALLTALIATQTFTSGHHLQLDARAGGLDLDLRRDDPYLAYAELPPDVFRVVTREAGDALARYECLLEQIEVSLAIAGHCVGVLEDLPSGPVNVRLPNVVRTPEGETYAAAENPLGINGYYLVSRGERAPWRLKLRTASFNNVQALAVALPGTHVRDLTTAMASFFYVIGDVDK